METKEITSKLQSMNISNFANSINTSQEQIEKLYQQDKDGDNLLMLSIIYKHEFLSNKIIEKAPSASYINFRNNLRQTALHLATITQQQNIILKLLIWGADITKQDRNGNTALHLAIINKDLYSVIALTTVITYPEEILCPYTCKYQIPQPQNILNYNGQSCLHIAAICDYRSILRYLLETHYSSDINQIEGLAGKTILHITSERGHEKLTKYLIQRPNIILTKIAFDNLNAYDFALGKKHTTITSILKYAGLNPLQFNIKYLSESNENEVCSLSSLEDDFDDITLNIKPNTVLTYEYDDYKINSKI